MNLVLACQLRYSLLASNRGKGNFGFELGTVLFAFICLELLSNLGSIQSLATCPVFRVHFTEVDKLVKQVQDEAETQVAKPLNEDQQFHTRANGVFKRLKTAKLEPHTRKKVESLLAQLEELLRKE